MPASIVCFRVTDASSRAVRVPNGAGGSVTLPLPSVTGDAATGSSASVYNDVDLVVNVNVESGEVVEVERLPDNETTQAVFGTLAALLLVMIATACGAVGARRYWRGS